MVTPTPDGVAGEPAGGVAAGDAGLEGVPGAAGVGVGAGSTVPVEPLPSIDPLQPQTATARARMLLPRMTVTRGVFVDMSCLVGPVASLVASAALFSRSWPPLARSRGRGPFLCLLHKR